MESEFVTIWKNKFGEKSFENADKELNTEVDKNQLNLFEGDKNE